jgi:hypothetical protein
LTPAAVPRRFSSAARSGVEDEEAVDYLVLERLDHAQARSVRHVDARADGVAPILRVRTMSSGGAPMPAHANPAAARSGRARVPCALSARAPGAARAPGQPQREAIVRFPFAFLCMLAASCAATSESSAPAPSASASALSRAESESERGPLESRLGDASINFTPGEPIGEEQDRNREAPV